MSEFELVRLGLIMEQEPGNRHKIEGTLNPATVCQTSRAEGNASIETPKIRYGL